MAYDSPERMNEEQKEGTPARRDNISYDPYTQVESYHGEVTDDINAAYEAAGLREENNFFEPEAEAPAAQERVEASRYEMGAEAPVAQERVEASRYEMGAEASVAQERVEASRYEMGAETAPINGPLVNDANDPKPDEQAAGTGLGMTAIGLSILSLFVLPYLTAPIGIVLGYLAFRRNARSLGLWSMVIGAVSIIGALVVYPYLVAK